jgi:hypothetical protein
MTGEILTMADVVDELQAAATLAIQRMREAALAARGLHARAELMRHMRGTAAKMVGRPVAEAASLVAREWMAAWHLDDGAYADLAEDVGRFVLAFCEDARGSTATTQQAIRDGIAGLDAALGRHGTSIADQMAWRSECAYGWWEMVAPTPADLPDRPARATMPRYREGLAFWDVGCATRCLPQ